MGMLNRPYTNPYSCCKLLRSYFELGEIRRAQKLFDEIPQRNIFAWSIMIHGYAKNGLYNQSFELFSSMRQLGLSPNSFTIVGTLVSVAGLRELQLAQSIHVLVVKYGLQSNPVVATAMLDSYGRCGDVFSSYGLFKSINNPGLVSCNALLSVLIINELFEDAVRMFNKFRRRDLVPSSATMLSVIHGCLSMDLKNLCESIHSLVVKFGLVADLPVSNSVLDMYSHLRDLDSAKKVFNRIEYKDVISWTTMMGLLNDLECPSEALKLFHQMRDFGVTYDVVTIVNLVATCTILLDLRIGKQVHAQAIASGCGSKLTVLNSITTMYAKCGDLDDSRAVFDQTAQKSLVSWSAIISGCAHNGHTQQALDLIIRLRTEEKGWFDSVILVGALRAAGELAFFDLCHQFHSLALRAGFPRYRSVMNSLISAYSKCGNVELAHHVFNEMGDDLRNVVSWNAILNGLGMNGHGRTAVGLFHEMPNHHKHCDSATYVSVLSACSHSGLVDEGLKIIDQMVEEKRFILTREHFGCVIDLLARAGCLSDLSHFTSKFPAEMGRNAWRALLSGCLLHGNMVLAEVAAERIIDLDPEDSCLSVLLSNTFASFGRFQDAEALRMSIGKKGLMKHPGISFLSVH
ncbi:hypothetical protein Nepgr_031176 [Nepenthes gracilis]|uniref:Pentatricopeptide repeat-containing protein n=1 Tax=Nepenthes gracilis TaxID=150966 RepID=A0AAD3THZ8_NEPGR|nr:hypothetical protein Nepgr_031176 [Nepenthes gracilis]